MKMSMKLIKTMTVLLNSVVMIMMMLWLSHVVTESSEEKDDNEFTSDNECSGNIDSFEEQCGISDLFVTTRSERIADSWRCSYFK